MHGATVNLSAEVDLENFLTPGRSKVDPTKSFPTFTTSRPRNRPGHGPAGLHQCDAEAIARWEADHYRYPPYQYMTGNCVQNAQGAIRLPNIQEKELLMGLPLDYTAPCLPKSKRKTQFHLDMRHTLVGNAWCVPVVGGLLNQDSMHELPGQGRLEKLLLRVVSTKGEDILLNSSTDHVHSFQRLRQTVPCRLWKWKVITGWKWTLGKEHIKCLELRALETAIRWPLECCLASLGG